MCARHRGGGSFCCSRDGQPAVGLLLGSRWQYRRLLRQIYDTAHG
jgi:hypothetical protein